MEELTTATISRRKLLKRAGIGIAAVGWSAPFLTSSASADVGIDGINAKCNANGQTSCPDCGAQQCATKNGTTCFCFVGVNNGVPTGCCLCRGNFFCNGATPCTSNSNCPSGFKCVRTCCGDFFCAPPCGFGISSAHVGAGKTAAG
jgi:hypothetical protein